jgi:hypothetical protein
MDDDGEGDPRVADLFRSLERVDKLLGGLETLAPPGASRSEG